MAYGADILTDSVNSEGNRLTTFELKLPRIVLAEFNTHRMISRNSASSRARPVEQQLLDILDDPFVPVAWGINQSGMQAATELSGDEVPHATNIWLRGRDYAALSAVALIGGVQRLKNPALQQRVLQLQEDLHYPATPLETPLHKQIANRLLEPYMWHTIIATATDWSNFFALRANPMAQPEIQKAAYMMKGLYVTREPRLLHDDEWHLPLIQDDEWRLPMEALKKMSVGRCARVSYLTHDTGKRDPGKDIQLHDSLMRSGHMSPFEHVARSMTTQERHSAEYSGNFHDWHQYRKDMPHEDDYSLISTI